jgi:hypothetical protein
MRSLLAVAAVAALLAGCGQRTDTAATGDQTKGPVVSASETPRNEAVDTTPTTGETAQTPGASSFTEAQARGAIESAGYTGVGPLTQNEQGMWQGKATKDGAEANVSVDYKGAVTAQ